MMNVDLVKERVEEAVSGGLKTRDLEDPSLIFIFIFIYHLSFIFITSSSVCYSMLHVLTCLLFPFVFRPFGF